jgi:hypothetical protein
MGIAEDGMIALMDGLCEFKYRFTRSAVTDWCADL